MVAGAFIGAPCVLDGPVNGRSYLTWVEQCLVPTLRPGDIVVLDNLGSHMGQAVREVILNAVARLPILPPHSPDLNLIEQVFAKLKTLLHKTAARTVKDTWKGIGRVPSAFTPYLQRRIQRRGVFGLARHAFLR
jgi:transposase